MYIDQINNNYIVLWNKTVHSESVAARQLFSDMLSCLENIVNIHLKTNRDLDHVLDLLVLLRSNVKKYGGILDIEHSVTKILKGTDLTTSALEGMAAGDFGLDYAYSFYHNLVLDPEQSQHDFRPSDITRALFRHNALPGFMNNQGEFMLTEGIKRKVAFNGVQHLLEGLHKTRLTITQDLNSMNNKRDWMLYTERSGGFQDQAGVELAKLLLGLGYPIEATEYPWQPLLKMLVESIDVEIGDEPDKVLRPGRFSANSPLVDIPNIRYMDRKFKTYLGALTVKEAYDRFSSAEVYDNRNRLKLSRVNYEITGQYSAFLTMVQRSLFEK